VFLCLDVQKYFIYKWIVLLNVRYKILIATCDSNQKRNLKIVQLNWISKRDKYLKHQKEIQTQDLDGANSGSDDEMILADERSTLVKKRVIELIHKSNKDYSIQ
jgi:uncharacterized protein YecT (DUF1311 family)